MAYIDLDESLPGMQSLLSYRPEIAPSLKNLMKCMMRSDVGLSMGERELIATYVSVLNDCHACYQIHGEVAKCFFENQPNLVNEIIEDIFKESLTERQKIILSIAKNVQKGGGFVTDEQNLEAKNMGISDMEIHDTVLIASMFCMFNRYIDGLGVSSNDTPETFKARARVIAEMGYGN